VDVNDVGGFIEVSDVSVGLSGVDDDETDGLVSCVKRVEESSSDSVDKVVVEDVDGDVGLSVVDEDEVSSSLLSLSAFLDIISGFGLSLSLELESSFGLSSCLGLALSSSVLGLSFDWSSFLGLESDLASFDLSPFDFSPNVGLSCSEDVNATDNIEDISDNIRNKVIVVLPLFRQILSLYFNYMILFVCF